jgi:hypothetical protein
MQITPVTIINMTREQAISELLARVEEVIDNNDWPTEEGQMQDDGVNATCPILLLVQAIKNGGN